MRIIMHPDVANLEEVVVVAYGTQKKVSVIGSVASIDRKDLMKSSSPNLSSALSGKLPGLTTIQTSGEPGRDEVTMFLRGAATKRNKPINYGRWSSCRRYAIYRPERDC